MGKKISLIENYEKFAKRGKTEKFHEYLQEEGLVQQFVTEVFNNTYGGYLPDDKRKRAMELTDFALQITREEWTQKYGENLAKRFKGLISEINHPSERIFHIYSLGRWALKFTSEEQMEAAEEILNLASKPGNIIGVHGTGAELGETILKQGLRLTGDLNEAYIRTDVKEILSRNIELFRGNRPLDVFEQVIDYSGWNKKQGTTCSDMVIISIPEDELDEGFEEIIKIGEDGFKYLNPEYINSYARVQRTPLPLELMRLTKNPLFVEKSSQKVEKTQTNAIQQSIDGELLYKNTTKSRLIKMREKISHFVRGVFAKESEENDKNM